MKTTKTISLIVALLFALVATSCGNKANAYLTDLEARVAALEEAMQAGDRAAYDEAQHRQDKRGDQEI